MKEEAKEEEEKPTLFKCIPLLVRLLARLATANGMQGETDALPSSLPFSLPSGSQLEKVIDSGDLRRQKGHLSRLGKKSRLAPPHFTSDRR